MDKFGMTMQGKLPPAHMQHYRDLFANACLSEYDGPVS
jgi:hypothetical protein